MINDKIKDENAQYNINREVAKIWALSSVENDKYEYLTGDKILPSDQSRIEPAKFKYSPLRKAFEKQIKTNWSFKRFKIRGKYRRHKFK